MDNESHSNDPYEAVLADLKAQRAKIDHAIEVLQTLRGGSVMAAPESSGGDNTRSPAHLGQGAFLGMTIVESAMKLLAHERRQMSNAQILEGLKKGGLVLNSADPINTVGSVLTRRFNQVGDVVRVGRGIWGLKEWYPNRSFNRVPQPKGASEAGAEQKSPLTPQGPRSLDLDPVAEALGSPLDEQDAGPNDDDPYQGL